MIIQITLPLQGTWHTREKRGDAQDSVRPLTLPWNIAYSSTLVTLDVENGQATYVIEIDDDNLMPALKKDIETFAALPLLAKRARIIAMGKATEQDALRIAR